MSSIGPVGGGSSYPLPQDDVQLANQFRQEISSFGDAIQKGDSDAFGASILNLYQLASRK